MLKEYNPNQPSLNNYIKQLGPGYCLPAITKWLSLEMNLPKGGTQKTIGEELRVSREGAGPGSLVRYMRRRGVDVCDIRNAKQEDLIGLLQIPNNLQTMICIWDDRLLVGEENRGICRADTHFMVALWTGEMVVDSSRTKVWGEESKMKHPLPDKFEPRKRRVFDLMEVSNGLSGIWRYTDMALGEVWKSNRRIRNPKYDGPWLMAVGVSGKQLHEQLTEYRKASRHFFS